MSCQHEKKDTRLSLYIRVPVWGRLGMRLGMPYVIVRHSDWVYMKMEHLSMHAMSYSNGCRMMLKCLSTVRQRQNKLNLLNLHPSTPALAPKQAPPLSPKNNVQRQKNVPEWKRATDYTMKHWWLYHKFDSWTSRSALFPPLDVSIHDGICLRSYMSVTTNYSCFVLF